MATAQHCGPGSVTVNVEQTWANPDLLADEIDNWSQEVHWSDSVTSNGIIEGEFRRQKSSPDGLSAFMWDVKFQRPENLPLTLDVVFSQRDGAWTRSASFKSVGDNVSREDATMRYENLNTQISFSYHDDALNEKSVIGRAEKTTSLLGQTFRAVAGGQWFEDDDKSSFGSAGMKFADSWVISGVGIQEIDGETTQHLASVIAFLQQDVGPFGGIAISFSRTDEDGWTGSPPAYLNYYVQKDTPILLFEVQALGDELFYGVKLSPR
jgi:hypothetical protein